MKKQTKYALLTISILVLLSLLVSAITFDSDPTINNLPPITGGNLSEVMSRTNLNCSWNATDSIQTNVSWYRNGVSILNKTVLSSYDIIENSQTSKGDTWNCSITITDGIPPSLTSWYAVVISNSPPEPPHVRDWNSDVVINWTHVYEDQNFLYQINSSDIDNDPLVFSVLSLESARSDLCAVLTPDNNPASIRCSPIAMDLDSIHVPTTRKVNFKVDENIEGIAYGISKTIYLNITPVNDTPIFMAGFPDDILTYQGNRTNFDYYDSGTGQRMKKTKLLASL